MLIQDNRIIGNKLFSIKKHMGMTQAQVAEAAGLSERAYADIERGTVNMRMQTILAICNALHITSDNILTDDKNKLDIEEETIIQRLQSSSPKTKDTALKLLAIYLESLDDWTTSPQLPFHQKSPRAQRSRALIFLFSQKLFQLYFEIIEEFIFVTFLHDFTFAEDNSCAATAGDAEVRFTGFTRAVDHTAHDRNF